MPTTDPNTAEPAWRDDELSNPHAMADKAQRVQKMFSAIAASYDRNNRLHSMWRDQAWRRKAVKLCNLTGSEDVLDVACGTGDLTIAFRRALDRVNEGACHVVGLDFTYEMLRVAETKVPADWRGADGTSGINFICGDAMQLPLADASVDIVSIAFGIRNVADPAKAIREFHRVLRPGGRVCILEFSLPTNPVLRGLYNFYFRHIMPRTATLISGDRSGAYKYLPQSVNTFLGREQMVDMLEAAGFTDVTQTPMTFGVCIAYLGHKTA